MLTLLLQDPVVWGSLAGLGVVVALCGYYLYLFYHNTHDDNP